MTSRLTAARVAHMVEGSSATVAGSTSTVTNPADGRSTRGASVLHSVRHRIDDRLGETVNVGTIVPDGSDAVSETPVAPKILRSFGGNLLKYPLQVPIVEDEPVPRVAQALAVNRQSPCLQRRTHTSLN